MPRIGDELFAQRRRHVLTSAWACFARDGFHASSMDQVIAAAGMSSNAVYRYFRSKEELIDATVTEALRLFDDLIADLLARDPAPGPGEVLAALAGELARRGEGRDYDLSRIAMQVWTEALRRPELRERVSAYYQAVREKFGTLARRWLADGRLGAGSDPDAVAQLLMTLMPGLVVTHHLVDGADAATLLSGIDVLGHRSD